MNIIRNWHLIDAGDKILGRLAGEAALLLRGKAKKGFVENLDIGDYVIVINSSKVKLSGKKETQKIYFSHSGYPGGAKILKVKEVSQRNPSYIIYHAVSGMLPNNKLRKKWLRRLFIYSDEKHPYATKISKTPN